MRHIVEMRLHDHGQSELLDHERVLAFEFDTGVTVRHGVDTLGTLSRAEVQQLTAWLDQAVRDTAVERLPEADDGVNVEAGSYTREYKDKEN